MRYAGTIVQVILASILLVYGGDWLLFHARSRSSTISQVEVQQYLATPLKGNKVEYDYLCIQPENCARSLFPHSGQSACWWLRRHNKRWQQ